MSAFVDSMEPFEAFRANARARLLAERGSSGVWTGELSSSALSTATATAALALATRAGSSALNDRARIRAGIAWLAREQNADGGYGDTTKSPSNLSTTALAWMALGIEPCEPDGEATARARDRAEAWLRRRLGRLDARALADGLAEVYGEDRTFAVPILVACAVGGAFLGGGTWAAIPRLPYELAALPQRWFKWLGLPVVSYALPALIAIGQAIEAHRPSRNPLTRALRRWTREPTLRVLTAIQPQGGGFLEATPLTSFVVMCLVSCGHAEHVVAEQGLAFLRRSAREDGSWPIDTNLATWLTSLSVGALAGGGELDGALDETERGRIASWLGAQQFRDVHPYTGAAPGGFAWTDEPGGVPDADDTAGAILALRALGKPADAATLRNAAGWLRGLQNRDGGIPTFCRGWGKLPFDQSCPDLTAHALRAWSVVADDGGLRRASEAARAYLVRTQRDDGSWVPLWFGNQHTEGQTNPVYGTSRVLRAAGIEGDAAWRAALERGLDWLLAAQGADGGFGGASGGPGGAPASIEETALALEALADVVHAGLAPRERVAAAAERAIAWLARATERGRRFDASPIGLYFAKLWYAERLYPLVFTVSALERWAALDAERPYELQARAGATGASGSRAAQEART